MRILFHNENYANYEDSGVATSADAHSLVFDEPNTPPPPGQGKCPSTGGPIVLAAATAIGPITATANGTVTGSMPTQPSSGTGPIPSTGGTQRASSRMSNTSTSTIKQHYYPEGGWGWIVIVVGIMVHTLTHGLQTSVGVLMIETRRRFFIGNIVDTGK